MDVLQQSVSGRPMLVVTVLRCDIRLSLSRVGHAGFFGGGQLQDAWHRPLRRTLVLQMP